MSDRPDMSDLQRRLVDDPAGWEALDAYAVRCGMGDLAAVARYGRRAVSVVPGNFRTRKNLLLALSRLDRTDDLLRWLEHRPRTTAFGGPHPVDLDAMIARYDALLAEAQRRGDEGWSPSEIEEIKRRVRITRDQLANFRRSEISSGTQTVPDRPLHYPAWNLDRLYPDISEAEQREFGSKMKKFHGSFVYRLFNAELETHDLYAGLAADDGRFGARRIRVDGLGMVSAKSMQAAYYACRIYPLVPRNGVVLEIGGGFGALAARLASARPDITYVLTDLPVNLVLTYTYLRSFFGDAVAGLWDDTMPVPAAARILVVPPWRLDKLDLPVWMAVNTMSFQHMDERNHAFYGAAMRRLGTRRLYHVNRERLFGDGRPENVVKLASQYAFMADYRVRQAREFDSNWVEVVAEAV